jgi:hypothetical protein
VAFDGDVVGVAGAGVDEFPLFAFEIGVCEPAAGSEHVTHEPAADQHREKLVFALMARHTARFAVRFRRLIATHHIQRLSVRRGDDAMRSMLARFARRGSQQFHGVELIVTIRVFAAVEAAALIGVVIHHAVKRSGIIKLALAVAEVDAEFLNLRFARNAADGTRRDAIQRSILITANETTFVIQRHRDPPTLLLLRHGVKQLDLETLGDFDFVSRRGQGWQFARNWLWWRGKAG